MQVDNSKFQGLTILCNASVLLSFPLYTWYIFVQKLVDHLSELLPKSANARNLSAHADALSESSEDDMMPTGTTQGFAKISVGHKQLKQGW